MTNLSLSPLSPLPAAATRSRGPGRLTALLPCDSAWDTPAELARAIRHAAPLLRDQRLVVVATWRSVAHATGLARAAMPAAMAAVGVRNLDRERHEAALRCAQRCAAIAQECGIEATGQARQVTGAWAPTAADHAHDVGADVIVVARPWRAHRLARALARAGKDTRTPAPLLLVATG